MKIAKHLNIVDTQDIADAFGITEPSVRQTYLKEGNEQKLKVLTFGAFCVKEGFTAAELYALARARRILRETL